MFAPSALTADVLISGVVTGMTIVAFTPSFFAESATPCAWLPADAQITPRSSSARDSCDILL